MASLRKFESRRWSSSLSQLPVFSIRQPFAWLVVNGIKDVENRSWRTNYRGPLLIHASKSMARLSDEDFEYYRELAKVRWPPTFDIGGIIGMVELVDCVKRHPSAWKERGSWGWVLSGARTIKFRECKGAVGFFYPSWT